MCPDGSTVPVTNSKPCTWAARPWQGYITNADTAKTADELRRKIESLSSVGTKNHAPWLEKVLELNDKTIPKENKIISPGDYLDKANYTDVIERDYGPPFKSIRFCVTSDEALQKCDGLSKSAFSRDIRPRFGCIQEKTVLDCLKAIRDNAADVITLDGRLIEKARDFNLVPILAEQYDSAGGSHYAVAVVKKGSKYNSFNDLKGAKSCHTGIGRSAGFNVPLAVLINKNLINKNSCPYSEALTDFFSESCLPGAKNPSDKISQSKVDKLCSLCVGNIDNQDSSTKCNFDSTEAYSGYTGAFRCLVQGGGDVAFVKHVTVPGNTSNSSPFNKLSNNYFNLFSDGKNNESWAINLKSENYELLCPNGGRASVDHYSSCHLAQIPPHAVNYNLSKTFNALLLFYRW